MTLIKSISGIRGTIGGNPEDGLNPLAIVKFVAAYATFIKKNTKVTTNKIVVGRDARISGPMVKQVVLGALTGMGFDVVDIDLATTPTTELAVGRSLWRYHFDCQPQSETMECPEVIERTGGILECCRRCRGAEDCC